MEKVKSLGLTRSQGPTFSLRGRNEIWGGPTVKKQRHIADVLGFTREKDYLYFFKDGDLYRAKMKRH